MRPNHISLASPPANVSHGRLLIFAKAPVPGHVKTRLMPFLDAEGCARLQRRLIERTLEMTANARLCPVELWCAPDCNDPFFATCARRLDVQTRRQQGRDLGMRMHLALSKTLMHAQFGIIIGCDCPSLGAAYLTQACEILADGIPVVLGPAEDGGYVLIGTRRATAALFDGIAWGTCAVLEQTRARLRSLRWHWVELAPLWDIDRPEDLARLTAKELAALGVYSTDHSRQPCAISG
jgi:rSAM/selenodomain-associated transferase 1